MKAAQAAVNAEGAEFERTDAPGHLVGDRQMPAKDPKTGKFLKAGQKPAAKAASATETADKPADAQAAPVAKKTEPEATGSLGKARRLVAEGKVNEALDLIGLKPDKIDHKAWKQWRINNEAVASAVKAQRDEVESGKAELDRVARQLSAEFKPLSDGKKAYEAGDYEEAFRLWTGEDLNSFQRKALQRMSNPGIDKDPAFTAIRSENAELRKQLTDFITQQQEAQKTQSLEQRRQERWQGMVEALKNSDDERIVTAADKGAFQKRVWQVLGRHYDEATDSTLPDTEAAEIAFEELTREYEEQGQIFGGKPADVVRDRVASNPATPDQGRNPARRPARAATSLSTSEAAEAAPDRKLRGKALLDSFIRRAQSERAREMG